MPDNPIISSRLSQHTMPKESAPKPNQYINSCDLAHGVNPNKYEKSDKSDYVHDPLLDSYPPSPIQLGHQKYSGDGEPRFFNFEQKAQALERQGYICPICGQSVGMKGSQSHHCIPASLSGRSTMENLVVVHADRCHAEADRRGMTGDMVVGGTIFDATPEQAKPSLLDRLLRKR